MKNLLLLLGLALAQPAYAGESPSDQKAAPLYEITATGDIEIGPDGRVHRYELDEGQPPAIAQALERSIAQWRFEPVRIGGRPVIAATRMRMTIDAEPRASGDYQLRIEGVWFGEPKRDVHAIIPPKYPHAAMRAGMGAKVVLALKLDDHGKVLRVHPEQVSLDHRTRNERAAEKWREMFAQASAQAAMRWTFDINETIGGEPVGASIRMPVTYSMSDDSTPDNTWRSYEPGPVQPVPWPDADATAVERRSLEDGEVQSLSSRFQLTTEVVGSVL